MAVVVTLRWAGVKPEHYDEIRDLVHWEGDKPRGAIFHCAAFDETGARITDVWETAEDFDAFVGTRLMPAVQKVGITTEPSVEVHPAHAIFAPAYQTGPGATHGDLEAQLRTMFDEIVNKGNLGLTDEVFADEFVSHMTDGDLPKTAFRDFVGAWRSAFPDIHCTVENVVREGDKVAWTVRATGTHQGEMNGIPATGRRIDFLSINEARAGEDGRFVEHWVVMDQLTMLQQLGVIPAMA